MDNAPQPPPPNEPGPLKEKLLAIGRNRHDKFIREIVTLAEGYGSTMDKDLGYIVSQYIDAKSALESLQHQYRDLGETHSILMLNYNQLDQAHKALLKQQSQGGNLSDEGAQRRAVELSMLTDRLQGELQMTTSELVRALEDVEKLAKDRQELGWRLEEQERANKELAASINLKTVVNLQLADIIDQKTKERTEKDASLTRTLGELEQCKIALKNAHDFISEYHSVLAPALAAKIQNPRSHTPNAARPTPSQQHIQDLISLNKGQSFQPTISTPTGNRAQPQPSNVAAHHQPQSVAQPAVALDHSEALSLRKQWDQLYEQWQYFHEATRQVELGSKPPTEKHQKLQALVALRNTIQQSMNSIRERLLALQTTNTSSPKPNHPQSQMATITFPNQPSPSQLVVSNDTITVDQTGSKPNTSFVRQTPSTPVRTSVLLEKARQEMKNASLASTLPTTQPSSSTLPTAQSLAPSSSLSTGNIIGGQPLSTENQKTDPVSESDPPVENLPLAAELHKAFPAPPHHGEKRRFEADSIDAKTNDGALTEPLAQPTKRVSPAIKFKTAKFPAYEAPSLLPLKRSRLSLEGFSNKNFGMGVSLKRPFQRMKGHWYLSHVEIPSTALRSRNHSNQDKGSGAAAAVSPSVSSPDTPVSSSTLLSAVDDLEKALLPSSRSDQEQDHDDMDWELPAKLLSPPLEPLKRLSMFKKAFMAQPAPSTSPSVDRQPSPLNVEQKETPALANNNESQPDLEKTFGVSIKETPAVEKISAFSMEETSAVSIEGPSDVSIEVDSVVSMEETDTSMPTKDSTTAEPLKENAETTTNEKSASSASTSENAMPVKADMDMTSASTSETDMAHVSMQKEPPSSPMDEVVTLLSPRLFGAS